MQMTGSKLMRKKGGDMSLKISYCKEGIRQYLVIESDGEEAFAVPTAEHAGFEEKMMEGQDSAFLLDFHTRSIDGVRKYYYDITGLVDMDTSIQKGSVSMQELETIIHCVCSACEDLGRYLLNADSLLLDLGCVYRDPDKKLLKLACIPGYPGDFAAGMESFAARLLGNVDYRDDLSVILAYDLYRCTSLPDFSVKSLAALLESGDRKDGKNGLQELSETESYGQKSYGQEVYVQKTVDMEPNTDQPGPGLDGEKGSRYSIGKGNKPAANEDAMSPKIYRSSVDAVMKEKESIPILAVVSGKNKRKISKASKSSERDSGAAKNSQDMKGLLPLLAGAAVYCLAVSVLWRMGYISAAASTIGLKSYYLLGILMGAGCFLALLLWVMTGKGKEPGSALLTDAEWDLFADDPGRNTESDMPGYPGAESWAGGSETVLLNQEMLIAGDGPEIKLISLNPEISGDIHINRFPAVIGSSISKAQILLEVPGVSRNHALLEREEGIFFLSDLHSTNGTLVNGKQLVPDRRCILKENDQVSFAQTPFRVEVIRVS